MATLAGGVQRFRATLRTRAALGLGPATNPVTVLLPLGLILGPVGTGLLNTEAIAHLDPVISIALATLGVFVGIASGTQRDSRRLFTASATQALVTMAAVALTTYFLLLSWHIPLGLAAGITAAVLGVAASASAAPWVSEHDNRARQVAARIADLDDVVPIVVGGAVLTLMVADATQMMRDLALTAAAGVGIGLSGWLLFDKTEGAERGVFVLGTLALLGGSAAYLGTSPLLSGLVAGFFWARSPGHTDRIAAGDLRKFQHPLVVVLLIVAGAGLVPSVAGVWLFAPYVLFRLAGKLVGAWFAAKVAPGVPPSDLGAYLLPPGVFGLAFALNVQQIAPESAAPLVFAVAAGAVASELLALLLMPMPESR